LGYIAEALQWYRRCLILDATDARIHASIGFTLHLLRRFDEAIEAYHRALSLQPDFPFCTEMLTAALHDVLLYRAEEPPQEPEVDALGDSGRAVFSAAEGADLSAVHAEAEGQSLSHSGSQFQSKVFINASNLWQSSPTPTQNPESGRLDDSYASEDLNSTYGSAQDSRVMGHLSLDSSGVGSASSSMFSASGGGMSLFGGKSMDEEDQDGAAADELAYYESEEDQ